jgi:CRP/FNR family transcriptional regulator, anaerobic regulatory protein
MSCAAQRLSVNPIADDGNELRFCSTCAFSAAGLQNGYTKDHLRELHVLVEHIGPFKEGQHIFREGDAFNAIAAVRGGTVKTYVTDTEGREQVQGFFLPGEVIGLNAISQARYPCNAVALDSVVLCRFSFPNVVALAARMAGLQQQLFRLLSEDIGKATLLAGNYTADERLAAFLISLSRRYAARGFPPNFFRLAMTREDIGNYLRLAAETVSRVFRRFQDDGSLRVNRRDVELSERERLEELARSVLRD